MAFAPASLTFSPRRWPAAYPAGPGHPVSDRRSAVSVILRPARSLDAGATGEILYAFTRDNDWMPKLYSRAETIAFCGTMIDQGWVTVAETETGVAGFLARDGEHVCALYLAGRAQRQGLANACWMRPRLGASASGCILLPPIPARGASICAKDFTRLPGATGQAMKKICPTLPMSGARRTEDGQGPGSDRPRRR